MMPCFVIKCATAQLRACTSLVASDRMQICPATLSCDAVQDNLLLCVMPCHAMLCCAVLRVPLATRQKRRLSASVKQATGQPGAHCSCALTQWRQRWQPTTVSARRSCWTHQRRTYHSGWRWVKHRWASSYGRVDVGFWDGVLLGWAEKPPMA